MKRGFSHPMRRFECTKGDTFALRRGSGNRRLGKLRHVYRDKCNPQLVVFEKLFRGKCELPEGGFSPI